MRHQHKIGIVSPQFSEIPFLRILRHQENHPTGKLHPVSLQTENLAPTHPGIVSHLDDG
jgi:hypothetical protein